MSAEEALALLIVAVAVTRVLAERLLRVLRVRLRLLEVLLRAGILKKKIKNLISVLKEALGELFILFTGGGFGILHFLNKALCCL